MILNSISAKPFIKWVGGKRHLLNTLLKRIPKTYAGYNECFLGGGALFFELQPNNAFLSDINIRLITTYRAIRDSVDDVLQLLEKHKKFHSKEYYLKVRKNINVVRNPVELASLFIYLNKACYNGLYRVNKLGQFNVPIGSYKTLIFDEENLKNVSKTLQNVEIKHCSFEESKIEEGMFFYLDPPYHKTFSNYNSGGFSEEDHRYLANFCEKLHQKNCFFMLSNSNTDLVRILYKDFNVEYVESRSFVSCKKEGRNKIKELLIRNYE